jgi:predicted MFS family arabinose efflux permease
MVPVIAREELGLTPFPTGILMSADGCGAFVGALLIAFFAHSRRFHQIYMGGSTLYLCCIMLFAFSGQFWLSFPALWLGGFGMSGFAAMQSALIIANSPPEMRNRVMGVLVMCIGLGPFGILMVGSLADWLGAAVAIRFTAGIGLIGMAAAALLWPAMRRVREP